MAEIDKDALLTRLHRLTRGDLDHIADQALVDLEHAVAFVALMRDAMNTGETSVRVHDGLGDDVAGGREIKDTDLEVGYHLSGQDLVVRVNKDDVQIMRVRLVGAARQMSQRELSNFNSVSPDFVFKVGDTRGRMLALARSVGLDGQQLSRLEDRLALLKLG